MRLFVDIENKKLVQSQSTDRSAQSPVFMQGDNEPIELHLLKAGESTLYEDMVLDKSADFLRIAIARFKGDPKMLSYISEFEPIENGGVMIVLPLNTEEIETAVGNNPSIDAFLEIEYETIDGRITTILQTTCKVKNDLIENAPNVEVQEQFYDRTLADTLFLKKSDNLESLSGKAISRDNLDVYSKDQVYPKGEVYKKTESDNLYPKKTDVYKKEEADNSYSKKSANLSDLAKIDEARNNLQVPHKSKIAPFGFYGVYSDYGFSKSGGNYGEGIGTYSPNFTIMTTFLCEDTLSAQIFSSQYAEYNDFYFTISTDHKTVFYGYIYDYDYETGEDKSITCSFVLNKAIEYGDKLTISVQNRFIKVYKNTELVGERQIEAELYINQPFNILSYKGLKKNFIYTPSLIIPITSAEGVAQKIYYSIEDFVNDIPPPAKLFNGIFKKNVYSYTEAYYGYLGEVKTALQSSFNGVYQSMKVYATTRSSQHYIQLLKYNDPSVRDFGRYKLRFKVYIPDSNTNLKRLQVRIGNGALGTSNFTIISSKNIDTSGYITATNAWTEVEVEFKHKSGYATTGFPQLYMYKATATTSFASTNEGNDDLFYIANTYLEGFEGLEVFYQGETQAGVWKNWGTSECNASIYNPVSYPSDTKTSYVKTIEVSSFQNSVYEYFDSSIDGVELRQIILKFNANVPDTSNSEYEYDRNIFKLSLGGTYVCQEQIPAISQQTAFNIYPKFGLMYSTLSSIQIDSMYSCSCGGTVILIFEKI